MLRTGKLLTGALLLLGLSVLAFCWQPDFDTLAQQAEHARVLEHLDDAVRLYHQAVQIRPDWAEGWWYLGTIAYDRMQYADAAASLAKVVALAPNDANGLAMLGLSEVRLNRDQAALSHLTQALALGLGDEANMRQIVLFNQANLLLNTGAFGRAQEILDNLAAEHTNAGEDLLIALGRAVLGVEAVKPDEQQLLLAAGHAEVLAANRQTQPAVDAYQELIKRFPNVHNVEFAYGRFLLANHLDDQAVAAFKREIENSPQHVLARLGIAGTLLANDPASGIPYAEQAVKLAPKLEEAHFLLGASLLATDDTQRALRELEIARNLKPDDARVYFRLANAYTRLNRKAEAAHALEQFAKLNQDQRTH